MKQATATTTPNAGGRPKSDKPGRYQLRHFDDELPRWRVAAASCGKTLPDWIQETLNAEAARATHVAMLKREGRRG